MRNIFFILYLLILSSLLFSKPFISIEETGTSSMILKLTIDEIKEKFLTEEGETYNFIGLDEFGYLTKIGSPKLPYRGISLLTAEDPKLKIEILESEIEVRENYKIYPVQSPLWAVIGEQQEICFVKDEKAYCRDSFYPRAPVALIGTMTYRGVPVTQVGISPIQFNPVTSKLKIYRSLTVRITYNPVISSRMTQSNAKDISLLKNVAVNISNIPNTTRELNEDYNDDILIVTVPKLAEAAESLAVWHRMKGYDVKIDSRDSWTTESIKSTTDDFYNNTTPKPGYVIILGDHEDLPATRIEKNGFANALNTDVYYSSTGGENDFVPEMSLGRISADNVSQAMVIVNKVINYEKNPPTLSSFYNSALGCAFFQDAGEDNMTGYADRAFCQVVERINNYLDEDHGITSKRIYCTEAYVNPTNWNNTRYSWGEPIPDYLRRPGFAWTGDVEDIGNGINAGAFLVYHYDHGGTNGWGDPQFYTDDIDTYLSNKELLPIIYSIDCLVGSFTSSSSECFAEAILRKENAGAVGIVAASTLSWSGQNDALLQGMIDATWPSDKMTLASPHLENPIVTEHDPIYTMGDILVQGKLRMSETWELLEEGEKYHYEMYHYFGDPTTEMWTKEPQDITLSGSLDNINPNANSYTVSGLNIQDGFVTLYNTKTGKVVGKKVISGGNAKVSLQNDVGSVGDEITVTFRSLNHRPLIKTVIVSDQAAIELVHLSESISLKTIGNSIRINKPTLLGGTLSLLDIKGRVIKDIKLKRGISSVSLNVDNSKLTSGVYIISAKIGKKSFAQTFNFNK